MRELNKIQTANDLQLLWSGRGDLNPRPPRPERGALTKLRYFPYRHYTGRRRPAVRQLSHMPGLGHERLELRGRRYLVWSVYSYLVIYRYGPKTLTVVRIVHGARDLRRLFPRG